jgi:hypothetical protein
MTDKKRKWLIILFVLIPGALILSVAVPLIFQTLQPLPPVPPLPNPNGYDDLVKAGEMILSDFDKDDYRQFSAEKLKALMIKNAGAFEIARMGLQQKSRVPLDYSATSPVHLEKLSAIKQLAVAFAAEGKLAETENRPNDAVKSYLDMVQLANQSVYGGTLIDEMVGRVTEAIGTENLKRLTGELDAKSCRETAAALETLDSQRQTWNEVMQQEAAWSRRTYPGLRDRFQAMMMANSLKKVFEKAGEKFAAQQLKTRQLIVQLAAHGYELDKGRPPANAADLVPDYLKAIPQDPLTGTNVVYAP